MEYLKMGQNKNIPIKNIYYMLAYAFHALNRLDLVNIETEKFDKIHDLFAAILGNGIKSQIKQGLYREYIEESEDLATLRGKINIPESIHHKIARRLLLKCEHDVLRENTILNQILKTTVMLLLRSDEVEKKYKDILKKEMMYFSGVSELDPQKIPWANVRFHRNNQTYQILIALCNLVLKGMLPSESSGEYRLASFVDDQCISRLYEKFVLEYYRKEFQENINAYPAQIPWDVDDGVTTMLPTMQSDITLSDKSEKKFLIIDTKYYSHTTQTRFSAPKIHSNNLYQIFAYVKNKTTALGKGTRRAPEVSGMLLYAKTSELIQPDVSYKMSGNRIDVRTLDLNCDFQKIRDQLDKIASDFLTSPQNA
ncbi:MAG: 5-methylcytosine-specific restriction endonuclease system specificity protein McrC [Porphyromonadaceae bacterium]|nr:5-methylcytosine-specific restriction endonuclease system specificity protein McrC [Porphyromonadaceae bacterium]